jgi:hypothetical protein
MKNRKENLLRVIKDLMNLHRRFLELEKIAAEKYFGRNFSPFEFLQVLTQDINFQWLYPLSVLIADLDAFSDEAEEISDEDTQRIKKQIDDALKLSRIQDRYQTHFASDPDFAVLHAKFVRTLSDF